MAGRTTDRRERFARSWKLIGIPSKSKWQGHLLNSRIMSKVLAGLMIKFQSQTLPFVENTCYELGKEDALQLKEHLKIKDNNARSCLEPIEMICLLNGLDAEIISEKKNTASLRVSQCPLQDVLVGIVPSGVVCKNYFRGMSQAINPKARFMQPEKICGDDKQCEFVININVQVNRHSPKIL